MSDEDWALAMESFFRARTEHYVNDRGQIVFEPHDGESGEPYYFGDPEPDGVLA